MTTDQSIFGDNQNQNQQQQTAATGGAAATNVTQENSFADLLGMIRNETGAPKYKSVPEALNGLAHAQTFIEQLKAEKAEAERKLAEAQASASKVESLESTVQELIRNKQEANVSTGQAALTAEQIAELVNQTLDVRVTKQTATQNTKEVIDKTRQQFGDQAEAKYLAAAEELGLTVKEMNDLAAKNPKLVLKALGVSGVPAHKQNIGAPITTQVNTAGFQPHQDSFVKRNETKLQLGATSAELLVETRNAAKMVDELHEQGMSVHDLADPKVYFKIFGNK